jgi:cytochrome c oxidase subunit 2
MPGSTFSPHSPQTQVAASLFAGILILAAAIFILVACLVCYSLVRYRARAGAGEPRQTFGSPTLETVWTAIPLILVTGIFIVTVRAMALIDAPSQPGRPPDLVVTGHQWWWQARYPNGAVTAGEIHIPVGKRLLAQIQSADVIHDFWVPQLARKMDAVPGRSGYIWLEADAPGTYNGVCSEFCGTQHAWMHFIVVAEPEAAFSVWVNHQAEPVAASSTESAPAGAALFQQKKCGDCHAISGTPARGASGPDLTHVASRRFLGSGISPNTVQNLALWSASPQSIKPGNRMPDQPLSEAERTAVAAYLETLR